jgi:very-short-patch-repair endonuclease
MVSEPRQFARDLRKTPTRAEDAVWQALRGRRLGGLKFKRQVPVLSYTVDFMCFERKLIVEIDGKQHEWFAQHDAKRTRELERHGFTVLRFTNDQVLNDFDSVRFSIVRAVAPSVGPAHPHPRPLSRPGEGSTREPLSREGEGQG